MIDFILKSMPIVVINEDVNESSEYLNKRHDLPTPIIINVLLGKSMYL